MARGRLLRRLLDRIKGGNWKRHTGALFMLLWLAAKQFGIVLPAEVETWLPIVAEGLWGVGWLDKFRRLSSHID